MRRLTPGDVIARHEAIYVANCSVLKPLQDIGTRRTHATDCFVPRNDVLRDSFIKKSSASRLNF